MNTNATRQAKHRARGRPVSLTITDPDAIVALTKLVEVHGGVKAAITYAVKATQPQFPNTAA